MSPELELQLDRLADLLARRGTTEYFANPLVTPEPKWFPERWTPDLGSVRTVLTRLANYCGLSGLGIEVGLFVRERDPNFLPSILERSRVERGAAALYMGTHENVAYFAVEEETLRHPEDLKGILAHEMAHAWRHACGLAVDDRKLEEELTDLTTIVLGFGILTTNASYSYEAYGSITGAMAYSGWSHRSSGYLPVETMSFLLAIHAVTRNEDLRQLRSHLNLTQRVAFERAAEWAEMMEIQERLGLPSSSVRAIPRLQGAGELTLPLSRAGSEIREALQRLREQTGEHGGLASSWLPLSVPVCVERNYPLAYWGRANLQGGRWRQLSLVSDPEWAIELLVLESFEEGRFERAAIGFLPDDTCGKKQNLESALTPLFEPASPLADRVMPDVPAFVQLPTAAVLGVTEFERLFTRAVARFPLEQIARETEWLTSYGRQILDRLSCEPQPGTEPLDTPHNAVRNWWKLVSSPSQADAEAAALGMTAADLEELDREYAKTGADETFSDQDSGSPEECEEDEEAE